MRLFALTLALLLAFSLFTGCGSRKGTSPEDQGLALIGMMDELAESGVAGVLSYGSEIRGICTEFGEGDYRKAEHIYQFGAKMKDIWEYLENQTDALDRSSLSASARDFFARRTFGSLPSMIISRYGAEAVAASSVLSAGKGFVNSEITESFLLFYTFDDGLPCLVCFNPGEGGAVSATAYFIPDADFDEDALEDILSDLDLDLKVTKIK